MSRPRDDVSNKAVDLANIALLFPLRVYGSEDNGAIMALRIYGQFAGAK